jgi:hypothetical protein
MIRAGGGVGNFLIFPFLAYLISYCFDLEMIFLTLNDIYILNQLIEFYQNISSKVPALIGHLLPRLVGDP